jgi:hypothetical protein
VTISASPGFIIAGTGERAVSVLGKNFVARTQGRLGGADRPTQVLTDSTLLVTLLASDVASPATAVLTVVNPPPGGGTSGAVSVAIGYPTATVTTIEPAVALVGESIPEIVVRGSGFVAASRIVIDGVLITTTVESDTVLRSTQTTALRATAGVSAVRVENPSPAGLSPSATVFTRRNLRPRVYSVSPDSLLRDLAPVVVVVNGEHFVTGAQAYLNGVARSTTRMSATQLRVSVTPEDVMSLGSRSLFVTVPAPVVGASDTVQVPVVLPPPRITRLQPASASVGSGDIVLQVRGMDFVAGAVVDWNGSARATTLVSDSVLTIQLTAADFAVAGAGSVVVRIPSRGTESFAATLPILAPGLSVGTPVSVALANRALASDPVRGVLYASVPASASSFANSIVKIDPLTGNILDDVFVGSDPDALAIADDGSMLYVGLLGATHVARINLTTFEMDGQLALPAEMRAEDILVLPGQPQRVSVSLRNTCCSPRHEGVWLFNGTTALPLRTPGHIGANRITAGPDATFLYGYGNESSDFEFRRIAVSDSGVTQVRAQSLFSGFDVDIESGGEFAYSTAGNVVSTGSFTLVGTVPAAGPVAPDAVRGRVHVLVAGTEIRTFHYASLQPLGTAAVAGSGLGQLIQWGSDGLALGRGDRIVILRGSLIGP